MPSFMESCCCAGRKPEGIVPRRHVSRSDLVARLLHDRYVARFIVAPTGFGKSCLAFEYANMVFSFQHVFWVNGRSPCFLRDLDAGALFPALHRLDGAARLVVFEDVPRLDADRTKAFGVLVDALLDRKIEVLATCVPSTDSFSLLQRDRMLLRGRDLLLGDEELRHEVAEGRFPLDRLASAREADRVACLRWGEKGERVLAMGMRREELPASLRLAMLTLLVLQQGHLDDLTAFLPGELARESVSLLDARYPFFGIDARMSTYSAAHLSFDDLAEAFVSCLDDMAASSLLDSRDALCAAFGNALLQRRETKRACAFMAAFASKHSTAQWLARCGWTIISRVEPISFCELRASIARSSAGCNDQLSSLGGWAALALGDAPSAVSRARRVVRSGTASALDKIRAQVLLARAGVFDARLLAEAERAVMQMRGDRDTRDAGVSSSVAEAEFDWVLAARVAAAIAEGAQAGLNAWIDACAPTVEPHPRRDDDNDPRTCALLFTAAWLMDACADQMGDGAVASPFEGMSDGDADSSCVPGSAVVSLERIACFVGDVLERTCLDERPSWHALEAGLALERLVTPFPRLAVYLPSSGVMTNVHRGEADLFAQRDEQLRLNVVRKQKRQEFQLTHPDAFRKSSFTPEPSASVRTGVPVMDVTLFGGLEVRLGDEMVDPRAFNRQKTRTLLALLVLSRGREMTRDRLASLLWPESCIETARRNLYSVWSQLRRALAIEGSCPYLIRSQSGFRLDARLVTSDAFAFEALCRSLLFGSPEADDWERLYAQVSNSYAEDLMPCEEKNELVDTLRGRYRMQLVDGMIAASKRLLLQGEPRGSLWFARTALERDRTREDAYVTLMEAQIGADQRGAALDTYFACRRFLTEELGIDPSPYIVRLYRSIIETEEVFV